MSPDILYLNVQCEINDLPCNDGGSDVGHLRWFNKSKTTSDFLINSFVFGTGVHLLDFSRQ